MTFPRRDKALTSNQPHLSRFTTDASVQTGGHGNHVEATGSKVIPQPSKQRTRHHPFLILD